MSQEFSAGAIIFHQSNSEPREYLLLKYQSGHWDFPKGHIEEGENDQQTVRREVEEETGLIEIKFVLGFKKIIKYSFRQYSNIDKKQPIVFKSATFYLAESSGKEIKLSSEHQDFTWLPIEQALEMTTFENAKEILKEAEEYLRNYKFWIISCHPE